MICKYMKPVSDLIITLLLWAYFTLGFILLFSPFYMTAYLFSKDREISFQRLNHKFYKGFFSLARVLIIGHKWRIEEEVLSNQGAVIICNHVSYLDPILLISLFEKQKTIVKSTFFKVPVFSRVLKLSGYIPSVSGAEFSDLMIQRIETMEDYLASGGNLFVFPEGTRSRSNTIGRLNKGAFKIARLCKASINVLFIQNTSKLFKPGKFLFNTCVSNTIIVKQLANINPDYQSETFSISELMSRVHSLLEAQM
ncbi:MAG: 1-acyl-sn-glycerol-3-phosphate acyltransferase [Desulfobacterales bacterium]|nr:1-acyl-sn-glycerol-3-phosphate acyltransferase [Desulfobacterales bacterium]